MSQRDSGDPEHSEPTALEPLVDPYQCRICGSQLVNLEGVGICPSCGFSWENPLGSHLWQLENEIAQLHKERQELVSQIRLDSVNRGHLASRQSPLSPSSSPTPSASPRSEAGMSTSGALPASRDEPVKLARRHPSLSVQSLLVGLGALLLVIASVIFAAVTWSALGAAGQAAVLGVATTSAAIAAIFVARRNLRATAEAIAVVAAGFAIVDIHAVRLVLAPSGNPQYVWAFGLGIVAAALVLLARVGGLTAPLVIAVCAAQLPLPLLGSLGTPPWLWVAWALVILAVADLVVSEALRKAASGRVPAAIRWLCIGSGSVAWLSGVVLATPGATGVLDAGLIPARQGWSIGVLAVAACVGAIVSASQGRRSVSGVLAALSACLVGHVVGVSTMELAGWRDDGLVLGANALPVVLLAATVPLLRRADVDGDLRLKAVQGTSATWGALSMFWWLPILVGSSIAPIQALVDGGWWGWPLAASTSEVRLDADLLGIGPDGVSTTAALGAALIGTVGAALGVYTMVRPRRSSIPLWLVGATGPVAMVVVVVIGLRFDLPVSMIAAVLAAITVAVTALPVLRNGSRFTILRVGVYALPTAAGSVVFAGFSSVATAILLLVASVLWMVILGRAVRLNLHSWTAVMTVLVAVSSSAAGLATALAAGSSAETAWLIALVVSASLSLVCFVAEPRADWWCSIIELSSISVSSVSLVSLAALGNNRSLQLGLLAVAGVSGIHTLRPSRRAHGAAISAVAALVAYWLRLFEFGVRSVEAYSLPAVAILGVAGWLRLREQGRPSASSWQFAGPALIVGTVPSLLVAIGERGVLRSLLLLTVGALMAVVGARLRLKAPLFVGAVTTALVALDQILPAAARLPRWVLIAAVGMVLLAVGATFERRKRDLVGIYHRYSDLR